MIDEIKAELSNFTDEELVDAVFAARRVVLQASSGNSEYYTTYYNEGMNEIKQRKLAPALWSLIP